MNNRITRFCATRPYAAPETRGASSARLEHGPTRSAPQDRRRPHEAFSRRFGGILWFILVLAAIVLRRTADARSLGM